MSCGFFSFIYSVVLASQSDWLFCTEGWKHLKDRKKYIWLAGIGAVNFLSKHRIFQWFTKRHFNFNFYCNGCLWILGQKLGPTSGSDLFWDDSKWFGAKSQLLPDNLTGVRESQPIKDGRGVEPVVEPVCAETSRFHNKPLAGFSTWSQLLLNLIEPHLCLKFWIYREISICFHLSWPCVPAIMERHLSFKLHT